VSAPKTGIRRIDDVNGGVIAWLYGETDLDDVMLALAKHLNDSEPCDGWLDQQWVEAYPYPAAPHGLLLSDPAWDAHLIEADAWRAAGTYVLRAEHPTSEVFHSAPREAEVGWFRRFPWCPCGEGHGWHYAQSNPGPGASLAVLVSWFE
jgi:hypothetical protein